LDFLVIWVNFKIQEAIKKTVEPLNNAVTIEVVVNEVQKTTTVVKESKENPTVSVDEKTLSNLKEKKETTYNALLEKVIYSVN
jgi:hypothetical protein